MTMEQHIVKRFKDLMKGKVLLGEELKRRTTFKIGGPAAIWAEPRDIKELKKILIFIKEYKIPFLVIGSGSNLLVNDNGFDGIAVHLGSPFFKSAEVKGNRVTVGAGYALSGLVRLCSSKGLSGLESLVGIPGTVGGAIYINAGGSGNPIYKNIGGCVQSVKVIDCDVKLRRLYKKDIEFGYRRSNLDPYIIVEADLGLVRSDSPIVTSCCSKFLNMKKQKQTLDMRSAGCVFKNPDNFHITCGQMIEMLGLKGHSIGGAQISDMHANFILNRKDASSGDVMGLIELIRDRVKSNYNIDLELEIKVI